MVTHRQRPWALALAPALGTGASNAAPDSGVYHCPSQRSPGRGSYGQNVYFELDPAFDDYPGSPPTWRRRSGLPAPGSTVLLGEGPGTADTVMAHFWADHGPWLDAAAARHATRSVGSFADGHAAAHRPQNVYDPSTARDA